MTMTDEFDHGGRAEGNNKKTRKINNIRI